MSGATHRRRPSRHETGSRVGGSRAGPGGGSGRIGRLVGAAAVAILVSSLAAIALTGAGPHEPSRPAGSSAPAATGSPQVRPSARSPYGSPAGTAWSDHWARVLHELDMRRARALATEDRAALAAVYPSQSPLLARDRAMMAAYSRRGLSVHGASMRLLDVRAHRVGPRAVLLRVIDRLPATTARTRSGATVPLPRDHATTHRLVLHRAKAGCRIAAVAARSG